MDWWGADLLDEEVQAEGVDAAAQRAGNAWHDPARLQVEREVRQACNAGAQR